MSGVPNADEELQTGRILHCQARLDGAALHIRNAISLYLQSYPQCSHTTKWIIKAYASLNLVHLEEEENNKLKLRPERQEESEETELIAQTREGFHEQQGESPNGQLDGERDPLILIKEAYQSKILSDGDLAEGLRVEPLCYSKSNEFHFEVFHSRGWIYHIPRASKLVHWSFRMPPGQSSLGIVSTHGLNPPKWPLGPHLDLNGGECSGEWNSSPISFPVGSLVQCTFLSGNPAQLIIRASEGETGIFRECLFGAEELSSIYLFLPDKLESKLSGICLSDGEQNSTASRTKRSCKLG